MEELAVHAPKPSDGIVRGHPFMMCCAPALWLCLRFSQGPHSKTHQVMTQKWLWEQGHPCLTGWGGLRITYFSSVQTCNPCLRTLGSINKYHIHACKTSMCVYIFCTHYAFTYMHTYTHFLCRQLHEEAENNCVLRKQEAWIWGEWCFHLISLPAVVLSVPIRDLPRVLIHSVMEITAF